MAISGQIRVGIIGAGLIGQTHSLMLKQIADRTEQSVRVVAIADIASAAAAKLAERWPGAKAVSSAREILDDAAIDAVWICTPTAMHRETCIDAALAGKHIFCEKPLAMSAAEAAEMSEAIKAAGVISQVGLVLRFSPVYTVMKSLIAEPEAGRVLAATMRDDQDFPIRGVHASGWRNDPKLTAGGTLVEHSVHDVDLFTWMFGSIRRLYCRTRNLTGAAGVEDFGATVFEFESGISAHLVSIWHKMIGRPSNRRFEIFAENLFIASDFDMDGTIVVQRCADSSHETIPAPEVTRRFGEIVRVERPHLPPFLDTLGVAYALEDANFLAALRGETRAYPEFDAGVRVQRIVESAYASARAGTPLDINN
jgi:predicted dehydrogenase